MFFQMAARRDPMADIRQRVRRIQGADRTLNEDDVRRAVRTLLDENEALTARRQPVSREDVRVRPGMLDRGDGPYDRPEAHDADRGPPMQYPVPDGSGGGGLNGHGYVPQPGDGRILTDAAFAEGANAPRDVEAIVYSIINRVRPQFRGQGRPEIGRTVAEVLERPGQFAFRPNEGGNGPEGSPNWTKTRYRDRMNPQDQQAYAATEAVVTAVLNGQRRDPTGGATFYFSSPDYDPRADPTAGLPGFFRDAIANDRLAPSTYASPYRRPRRRGEPSPHYFFVHADD